MGISASDEDKLLELTFDVLAGSAVCFLGSGFSLGATDRTGKLRVPSASAMTADLLEIADVEEDEEVSLTDIADYCERAPVLNAKLRDYLVNRLTQTRPSKTQLSILALPWRAVFTTNFDDVAEQAVPANRQTTPITPAGEVNALRPSCLPIYYLHGRARDISQGKANPGIILSESSYLGLRDKNRPLFAALENELHTASSIFFFGYSLRDAEIASRIFNMPNLKSKSIIVSGSTEGKVSKSRLEKFGSLWSIGTEGFADLIAGEAHAVQPDKAKNFRFLSRVQPVTGKQEIENGDFERLILAGQFDYSCYALQERSSRPEDLYCVSRKKRFEKIFEPVEGRSGRFIVTSGIGNGKSVALEQISYEAHQRGYEVFTIQTQIPELFAEIDVALASDRRTVYLVDGHVRYQKVATYIGSRLPGTSILVISASEDFDQLSLGRLGTEVGGAIREVDLNILTDDEISQWNKVLERWGYWEERIQESEVDRHRFLREECNAENRSIVLAMFDSPKIGQKIEAIVTYFLGKGENKTRGFIAMLINALCHHHVSWSRIVDWLDIDEAELKAAVLTSPLSQIVGGRSDWFQISSPELAGYVFTHYDFEAEDVVDTYTRIVRETAYSASDPRSGFDARENLKELMRFRFLTRIFSRSSLGSAIISAVYHRLSNAPRIRENDQFWLQYAMARAEDGDIANAESYINTAFGIASKKGENYSKRQILDQRARLYFRKNARLGTRVSAKEISSAIDDLIGLLNERGESAVHPLRSSAEILRFLENRIDDVEHSLVVSLRNLLELMQTKLPKSGRIEKSRKGETESIRKSIRSSLLILSNT